MSRKPTYDKVLCVILMTLLFLPMLQGRFQLIPLKPLNGVTLDAEKPVFDKESYCSGDFAKQEEAYLGQHFGFREPVIRLYNQYLWSCYRKTYAQDVTAGKKGWLYYPASVRDYYGKEMLLWQNSPEDAQRNFDRDVKHLNWVRTILKENGVELLVFIAPEKGVLYSEYLPDGEYDTATFNACKYYEQRFQETGFPCIEMTRWFQQMKDTVDYPLIPQAGAHWLFPSVYAVDSLLRLMEELKEVDLPKLKIGKLHESDNHGADNELEHLLNLELSLPHSFGFAPTAEVTVECDSTTVKPRVLFIGNSFFWAFQKYLPLEELFENVEFWYYFTTAYFGEGLQQTCPVSDYNLGEKLLGFDYVVWFSTGNQMNKGTMGFAPAALVNLALDDSTRMAYANCIADTLTTEATGDERFKEALSYFLGHPDLIPELRGDSLSVRNIELAYIPYIREIRSDSVWMAALEAQGFLRSASLWRILHVEIDRWRAGQPLYRDQQTEIAFGEQCLQEVEALKTKMIDNEKTMKAVKEHAEKYGKTMETALDDDAKWLIRKKYHLDRCRLADDPDAEIPIPPTFNRNNY